jgi:hypothetical protein
MLPSYSTQDVFQLQTKILTTLRDLGGSGTSEQLKAAIGHLATANAALWNAARRGLYEEGLIVQDTPYSRMFLPEVL